MSLVQELATSNSEAEGHLFDALQPKE